MSPTGITPDGKKRQVDLQHQCRERGAGTWPTPHANAHTGPGTGGRQGGKNLQTAVVSNWPTPSVRDYKDSPGMSFKATNPDGTVRNRVDLLPRKVYHDDKVKLGMLNPDWVEWLMGLPTGWTDLDGKLTPHTPWPLEPLIPRVVESCENRIDRIRLLGNGVVPQTVAKAWEVLSAQNNTRE